MQELIYITTAVFFGFSILNILIVMVRVLLKKPHLGKRYLDVADRIIVWNGIVFTGLVIYQLAAIYMLIKYSENTAGEEMVLYQSGPYLWYMTHLIALFIGPQLFWLSKVKLNNLVRFLLAFIILIASKFEEFVIIVTTLHRDYLPARISSYGNLFVDWLVEFLIFGGVFFLVFMIISFGRKQRSIALESENRSIDEDI